MKQSVVVPTREDHRFNAHVELAVINCGMCGGTYAINERHRKDCSEYGKGWTCPYCKTGWGYFDNGETDRLKKQLAAEQRRREQAQQEARLASERAQHERHRANGYKGAMTKARKRVGKGVCPCCEQTFPDLLSHMLVEHPEYADNEAPDYE